MSFPPHHDVHAMSPMTPRWHTCHLWHRHGINDTIMATMTPRCPRAGKWRFCCKTMEQYGTVCNICPPHLTMTYMLCHPWHHDGTHVTYDTDMESMTPSWQQWHHAVLELVKGDSVVKQWHNMAQYVIYVLPISTCVMSPMTPRWHSCHLCHRHWINDTLSWRWERAILV